MEYKGTLFFYELVKANPKYTYALAKHIGKKRFSYRIKGIEVDFNSYVQKLSNEIFISSTKCRWFSRDRFGLKNISYETNT